MGLITQVKQGEDAPTVVGVNGTSINFHPQSQNSTASPLAQKQ